MRAVTDLSCEPWHGVASFIVGSESRKGVTFGVELLPFQGFGQCDCEHFKFNIQPKIIEHGTAGFEPCKHIMRARLGLAEETIKRLLILEREGKLEGGGHGDAGA